MSDTTQKKAGPSVSTKIPNTYPSLSRDIKESSLKNKDVAKMILIDRDRLEAENIELNRKISELQGVQLEYTQLKEKLKTSTGIEIISTGAIAMGSLMVAGLFTDPINWTVVIPGIFFIIIGIVAKAIKWG